MAHQKKQPNFVFVLSDDQGYWSLGSYGNTEIQTPVLDRLAREGVRSSSCYCVSPVCSPARASILTGQIPSHHGVLDWLGGGAVDKRDYASLMLPRELILNNLAEDVTEDEIDREAERLPFSLTRNFRRYMRNENEPIPYLKDPTCTERLAAAGYRCGIAGKWHLGAGNLPQAGFSFWSVIPRGGTPYRMPDWISGGEVHVGTQYVTSLITDEAIRFLDGQPEDCPFYLSVHYTAPHDPWRKQDHPAGLWAEYEDCPFDTLPRTELHKNQVLKRPHPKTPAEFREMAQAYYTSITAMDQNIGRLLDALQGRGLLENTVVVFTSDNGMNFGHHGIWGKGNGTWPINLYETSVRVPFLLWAPGLAPSGQVIETPVSHYDIYPTLLALAGLEDKDYKGPGVSLLPLLRGDTDENRTVVVCDEYGPMRMLRKGPWKLIANCRTGACELYRLSDDPNELTDLSRSRPETAAALKQELLDWFASYSLPDYDALQYPVNGEGQMRPAPDWHRGKTVFVTQTGEPIRKEVSP